MIGAETFKSILQSNSVFFLMTFSTVQKTGDFKNLGYRQFKCSNFKVDCIEL